MLRARVMFRFDSVQEYYQSFDELFAVLRPAYLARRHHYFEQEAILFATVLDAGIQDDVFAPHQAQQLARTLLLATNALLPYSLTDKELGAREEMERDVIGIADVLLQGVLTCRDRSLGKAPDEWAPE